MLQGSGASPRREFRVLSLPDRAAFVAMTAILSLSMFHAMTETGALDPWLRIAVSAFLIFAAVSLPLLAIVAWPYLLVLEPRSASLHALVGSPRRVDLTRVNQVRIHNYRGRRVTLRADNGELSIPLGTLSSSGEVLAFLEELSATNVHAAFDPEVDEFLECRRLALRAVARPGGSRLLRAARRNAAQGRLATARLYYALARNELASNSDSAVVAKVRELTAPGRRVYP